ARQVNRGALALLLAVSLQAGPLPADRAGAAVNAAIGTWTVKAVRLPVTDVAYDHSRDVLLATVEPGHSALGNELVEVDPETGALGRHVFVGSDPGPITLTDDGTTAYVGLRGANRIAQVDLTTFGVSSFETGTDQAVPPQYVRDLEAAPGRNDVVIAALSRTVDPAVEVWAFDDGVRLPDHIATYPDWPRSLEFGSATTAYGYDPALSAFSTIQLGPTGLSNVSTTTTSMGVADFELAGGLVYSTSGKVIQPSTGEEVRSFAASGLIEVTPANERITFLGGDRTVSVFDTGTGAAVGARTFPDLPTAARALVASATGFAAASGDGLFLLGPSVTASGVALPADPTSTVGPLSFKAVPLRALDMVYDGGRERLYVSVRVNDENHPNRVVALDPATGAVLDSVAVGTGPGPLALADDGSVLHVGVGSEGKIAQINPDTFAVTGSFPLGTGQLGADLGARDIALQPGTTDRLAVALGAISTSGADGIAVFDDGVRLPASAPSGPAHIAFADASTLVGSADSGAGLYRMAVDAAGVTLTGAAAHTFGRVWSAGGRVYGRNGKVADPYTLDLLGTSPGYGATDVRPDLARTFAATSGALVESDLTRFRQVARWPLPSGILDPDVLVTTSAGLAAASSNVVVLMLRTPPTPAVTGTSITQQHTLAGYVSVWVPVDGANPANVTTRVIPAADTTLLVTANADLWTFAAGFNQDLAIFKRVDGGPWTMVAWKESGGFAGTLSPNAASVQALVPATFGMTYDFQLRWKPNKASGDSTIAAGAGPIDGAFSPTSIIVREVRDATAAVSTQQYTLVNSDGATWVPVDAGNPDALTTSLTPVADGAAVISGSADLWTWDAGFNQDLAVFVSDNGGPFTLLAWKESGGFAGTFSPNAAAVHARIPVTAGHIYDFRLYWKANKAGVSRISAGAGPLAGAFSPTSVVAYFTAPDESSAKVSTTQYNLDGSDGATWVPMDGTGLTLRIPAPAAACSAVLTANTDLWTWTPGVNQDVALYLRRGTGPYVQVAWKESGGFGGTFSPNAAALQAAVPLSAGETYDVQLRWKANKAGASRISAGAGPVGGQFSPTSVMAHTFGCS
ncbi:MAG TPA: hypothetical protein VFO65_11950, partial [Acidimicrobiales bacterium]|nr:hypothetical protein [Acidimicrobiales bacterium]